MSAMPGRGCQWYIGLSRRVLHSVVGQRAFRHKRLQRSRWNFTEQVGWRLRRLALAGASLIFSGSIASFAGLAA